jgi:hypothetical protein
MARYRIKPFEIEAEQYLPGQPVPAGLVSMWGGYVLMTLNGHITVQPTDFVVTFPDGTRDLYPADAFEAEFETIPEDPVGT